MASPSKPAPFSTRLYLIRLPLTWLTVSLLAMPASILLRADAEEKADPGTALPASVEPKAVEEEEFGEESFGEEEPGESFGAEAGDETFGEVEDEEPEKEPEIVFANAAEAHVRFLDLLESEKRFPSAAACATCHPDHFRDR